MPSILQEYDLYNVFIPTRIHDINAVFISRNVIVFRI